MGNRAYDIVNVIPEMELIIGKQKQVADDTGVNTDGFGHLLQSFITAFADQLSTLVFFIDDLHWADQESQELISELKKEFTIVIVTHNMQQAARISDRTAFFYLGKLIEEGKTVELFSNPSHKETEDYISGRFG